MNAPLLTGGFADPARDRAHAFRAVLEAMARPGTIQTVAGHAAPGLSPAASTLLLVLTDQTTPLHLAGPLDTDDLRGWIVFHAGAPLAAAPDAAFALGRLADHALAALREGDDRRGGAGTLRVFEHDRLAAFHDGQTGVGGAEVDTENLGHDEGGLEVKLLGLPYFC